MSIIVPINDKPEIIRKCINALSEQTYKNIELVVADDPLLGVIRSCPMVKKIYHSNKELVQDFARSMSSSQSDISTVHKETTD